MDEPIVQIGGDDAELRPQLEHVPAILAEDADRRGERADSVGERVLLQREQLDEGRFAGAVGPEDRGVLADGDRQRERVEHARLAEHDRRVVEFEQTTDRAVADCGLRIELRFPQSHSDPQCTRFASAAVVVDLAASGARPLIEPTHHVELRPDVVRRLRAGAVILLVELQQLHRHALHLQRRVILLGLRHRRAAIEHAGHQQRRRRHLADRHQRRVRQPVRRIFPERLLEEAVGEERHVGMPRHAQPVDHRAAHRGRGEPIGVADHPARQHAAAAAARDVHPRRVDVAFADDGVDAGHQIVVVGSRIVVIDAVDELAAVAGAAARVRDEHDEAVGREVLEHVVERRRCSCRTARRGSRGSAGTSSTRSNVGGLTIQPITLALPLEV